MPTINTRGHNGQQTRQNFLDRRRYRLVVPASLNADLDTSEFPSEMHDFWTPKGRYYGLVDKSENILMLNEKFLKSLHGLGAGPTGMRLKNHEGAANNPISSNQQYALNFVSDAFADFRSHLAFRNPAAKVKGTPFDRMKAKRAWVNADIRYNDYILHLFKVFRNSYLKNNKQDHKINNFDQFASLFLGEFAEALRPDLSMTRGMFLARSGPESSGLCIDISLDNHGNDGVKAGTWLNDPVFNFFRYAAARHGFMIDKNAPWRLVANLNSPIMKKYMKRYDIYNTSGLFEKYFVKAYKYDIEILKVNMLKMYNQYVSDYPAVAHPRIHNNENTRTTRNHVHMRNRIEQAEFDKKYDDEYWIKLYLPLRLKEGGAQIEDAKMKRYLQKATELNKFLDFDAAMGYINKVVKKHGHGPGNLKKAEELRGKEVSLGLKKPVYHMSKGKAVSSLQKIFDIS